MSQPIVIRGSFVEGQDFNILARVTNREGTVLTSGSVTAGSNTLAVYVYDKSSSTPTTVIASDTTLRATDVIQDTLLTSTVGWDVDNIGANFVFTVVNGGSGTSVPAAVAGKAIVAFSTYSGYTQCTGGHTYRFEFQISTDSYGVIMVIAELACLPMYST